VDHVLATPSSQQAALQLPSPHTEQEALQQPLQSPLKDKKAPQLPAPPTETEASKDQKASPVKVMPPPPSRMTNPPSSSPYDIIHEDLALYKTKTRLDPTDQFFVVMKNLKSPPGTSSVMSGPAQHAKTYMRSCKIKSYEEDGEIYNRDKLLVRLHDPIFMKEHVPKFFVFGQSIFTSAQLSKRHFSLM
jgi:hypothetical protein